MIHGSNGWIQTLNVLSRLMECIFSWEMEKKIVINWHVNYDNKIKKISIWEICIIFNWNRSFVFILSFFKFISMIKFSIKISHYESSKCMIFYEFKHNQSILIPFQFLFKIFFWLYVYYTWLFPNESKVRSYVENIPQLFAKERSSCLYKKFYMRDKLLFQHGGAQSSRQLHSSSCNLTLICTILYAMAIRTSNGSG